MQHVVQLLITFCIEISIYLMSLTLYLLPSSQYGIINSYCQHSQIIMVNEIRFPQLTISNVKQELCTSLQNTEVIRVDIHTQFHGFHAFWLLLLSVLYQKQVAQKIMNGHSPLRSSGVVFFCKHYATDLEPGA